MGQTAISRLSRFRRVFFVVLGCYWFLLFVATHTPPVSLPQLPKYSDKAAHFVMYAGLAYLLALCYLASRPMKLKHYWAVFLITAIYAVVDELLQLAVNRHSDFYDGMADALGSLTGLAAFTLTHHLLERHYKQD